MSQLPVTVGTTSAKADLDTNFTNIQSNFTELYRGSVVAPVITGIPATDTAAINAALLNGNKHVLIAEDVTINAPLVIYSNTHLELAPGVTVTYPATTGPMLSNHSAFTPQRTLSDAAMTAGTTTLTSATAAFTSADIGRSVIVTDAGSEGDVLCGVVVSVTDATTAILSVSATGTVSGKTCLIYDRDSNIKITLNGTVDLSSVTASNGTGSEGNLRMHLFFRRIDGLVIAGGGITSGATAKYGISIGDCERFYVSEINFDSYADGVHIVGPAKNGVIENIYGQTRDDVIAFTTTDYIEFRDIQGPISNVHVRNVDANSTHANSLKVVGNVGNPLTNISVSNFSNSSGGTLDAIVFDDPLCGVGTIVNGLLLDNFYGEKVRINLTPTGGGDITLRNITNTLNKLSTDYESIIYTGAGASINSLRIENINDLSASNRLYLATISGSIGVIQASKLILSYLSTDGGATAFNIYGSVDVLSIDSVVLTRGKLVHQRSASTVSYVSLTDIHGVSLNRLFETDKPANVKLTNFTTITPKNPAFYVAAGGSLQLSGSGYAGQIVNSSVARAGSESVIVKFLDLPCNLTQLTPTLGSYVYNTNAALACGVGPVISNDTIWKHMYTGATY